MVLNINLKKKEFVFNKIKVVESWKLKYLSLSIYIVRKFIALLCATRTCFLIIVVVNATCFLWKCKYSHAFPFLCTNFSSHFLTISCPITLFTTISNFSFLVTKNNYIKMKYFFFFLTSKEIIQFFFAFFQKVKY